MKYDCLNTAAYLDGKTNQETGKIELEPKCIRNAISGRPLTGTNQLIAQNALREAGIEDNEVVTFDQAKDAGTFIRKGSVSFVITLPAEKDEQGNWKQSIFRMFPKSAAYNPGAITLAKINEERLGKINYLRTKLEKEQNPEIKEKILTSISYEHLKTYNYINAKQKDNSLKNGLNDEWKSYAAKNIINAEEKNVFNSLLENQISKNYEPGMEQIIGLAVAEENRNQEHQNERNANIGKGIISAENCISGTEYLGKYLAAATKGAVLVTDRESLKAVQEDLNKKLEKEFNKDNFMAAFYIGKDASEICKEELKEFREKSKDQQLGIEVTKEREHVTERPEQNMEMTV